MIRTVTNGCPFGKLLFRIDHFIRTIAQQEFCLYIPCGPGNHQLASQLLEQRGGFQRALEVIANGNNTDIKIPNAQGFQKFPIGTVTNLGIGNVRQNRIHTFFYLVNCHHLMAQFIQMHGNMTSKTSQSN